MDKKRWETIHQIVDTLLTLPEDKKDDYLQTTCGDDEDLIREVREYLDHIYESEKSGFLSDMAGENSDLFNDLSIQQKENDTDSTHSLVGKKVGNYQISKLINEGGMGQVYLGERVDGEFNQKVAIKFLNQRSVSKDMRLRFSQEKKILGNLKHPNIALLLDGGVLENGSPYLIMEYIDGTPIDEYCNENKLNVNERLILFKEVLKAIDFAHSNLVVHRDLKPSNIFINKNGRVKILDFGIAKLMQDDSTADIKLTKQGQRLWTPQFAAPEQILEKPPLIQTDIYALGTLLHLLLTNDTPFDLSDKSLHEVEKVILNETPKTLTASLSEVSEKEIQGHFSISKKSLMKTLKRDLEAIVSKTLRKEPEDRYNSAQALMIDIENYESDYPVLATRGNRKYRLKKYFKRNNKFLTPALVMLIVITGLVSFYTYQLSINEQKAQLESQKATQISSFLTGLFSQNYPEISQGEEISARQLLDEGHKQVSNLSNQKDVQISMLNLFANIYHSLEVLDISDSLAHEAIRINEEIDDPDEIELASSNFVLALVNRDNGNYDESLKHFRRSLELQPLTGTKADTSYAARLSAMAYVLRVNDQLEEAVEANNEAIDVQKRLYGESDIRLAETYYIQASILRTLDKYEEALDYQMMSYNMVNNLIDGPHPGLAANLSNLALLYSQTGDLIKSEEYNRQALEMTKELYGESHSAVITSTRNLGAVLEDQGKYDEALKLFNQALDLTIKNFGENHINTAFSYRNLGNLYVGMNRFKEAEEVLFSALDIQKEKVGEKHLYNAVVYKILGNLELRRNNTETARDYYNQSLDIRTEILGSDHSEVQEIHTILDQMNS
ncbi:MAG TPA: tetratricopeptide repeat protein [Gracilimonas sp.]|nr:tetratricopeptide repeat protein [Gracilimonas sp.]